MIITISREYGAGGRAVGKLLAGALDIAYYDQEIIANAAIASGFSAAAHESLETRASYSLLHSIYSLAATDERGIRTYDKLFDAQCAAIQAFAAKGDCVLIGRCADYVLRERQDAVHIFMCADVADRLERARSLYAQAISERELHKRDRRRAAYYNYYTGETWGLKARYHLCINTSKILPEQAANLIANHIKQGEL